MGLETFGFINSLVRTNPVGATDPKSQGDDHLRGIKGTLLDSFTGITGAVTATHTQLNVLATDGAGAGMLADIAAIADPNADRILGWDDSASAAIGFVPTAPIRTTLTALEIRDDIGVIADLAALTDPNADVFYGWDDSATALIGFTLVSGELLTTGTTLGVGSNIPKLDASNTFSRAGSTQIFRSTSGDALINIDADGATDNAYLLLTSDAANGYVGIAGTTNSLVTGATHGDLVIRSPSTDIHFTADGGTTIHFSLSSAGLVTTPHASAQEVGYQGTPEVAVAGSISLSAASHMGRHLYVTGASAVITCPATVQGFACTLVNNSGGNITLAESSTSLYLAGAAFAAHGTRTIAHSGVACIQTLGGSTAYVVSGTGVS